MALFQKQKEIIIIIIIVKKGMRKKERFKEGRRAKIHGTQR